MCIYLYTNKDTLENYCEILDMPCNEDALAICPLSNA